MSIATSADLSAAGLVASPSMGDAQPAPRAIFNVECVGPDGEVKWTDVAHNLVTTAGKTLIMDTLLKGSGYTGAWFLVLKTVGTPTAADTLTSPGAWTETRPYAGSTRPAITWGTTTSGSNTSSPVAITINANATVAGAGTTTNSNGTTTTGTLYNVGDFSAARTVASGDVLNITVQLTIS